MALTNCKECKREVSAEAKTCPHCGIDNPGLEANNNRRVGVVVFALLVFLGIYLFTRHEKEGYQHTESAKIREHKEAEVTILDQKVKSLQFSSEQLKPKVAPVEKASTSSQQPSLQAAQEPSVNLAQSMQEKPKPDKTKSISSKETSQTMVMRMLEYALEGGGLSHDAEIQRTKRQIESLPRSSEGNKKEARIFNAKGLAFSKEGDLKMAVKMFEEANKLAKSDIEITNNLGFAYFKKGNLNLAQHTITQALTLSPGRATAWENLGEVFGVKGDLGKAAACFSNAYRFSKDKLKMHQYLKKINEKEDVKNLKKARATAINWAEKSYPNISKKTE